jgi:hypothetical protein
MINRGDFGLTRFLYLHVMKVISLLSQSSKIYGLSLSQCGDWTVGQSLSLMLGLCLTGGQKKGGNQCLLVG